MNPAIWIAAASDPIVPKNTTDVPAWLVVAIPAVITLLGVLATNIWGAWNRRHGAVEAKGPTVDQAWKQADSANAELDVERDWRRDLQDAFRALKAEAKAYIRIVVAGGGPQPDPEFTEALAADPRPPTPSDKA